MQIWAERLSNTDERECAVSDLKSILSVSQLQMQFPEDSTLVASVLNLHAGPPGVPLLRRLDVRIAPHASCALRVQGV